MIPLLLLFLGAGAAYSYSQKNTKVSPKPKTETKTIVPTNNLKSELIIYKDCKSFSFSDKTGDKWWELEGRKIAQKFAKIYSDSLVIAFGILNEISQTKESPDCFRYAYQKSVPSGFPVLEFGDLTPQDIGITTEQELAIKRLQWIRKNPQMWNLIWQIRNRVNIEFFNGRETVIADPNKPNYGLTFGNQFNEKTFFKRLKPMVLAMLQIEESYPGILLSIKREDHSYIVIDSTTYLFWVLMPNIPFSNLMIKFHKVALHDIPFYDKLIDFVVNFEGEHLDMGDYSF